MGILNDLGRMGGTALGAEFGPVGSQIGGALGDFAGGTLGNLFGGGSSPPPPPPVQFSSLSPDQQNAYRKMLEFAQNASNRQWDTTRSAFSGGAGAGAGAGAGGYPQQQAGLGEMLGGMGSQYARGPMSQKMGEWGQSLGGMIGPEYANFGGTIGRYAGNQLANYGGRYLGGMAQRGLERYAPSLAAQRFSGPQSQGMGRYGVNQMVPPVPNAPPNPPNIWGGPRGLQSGVNNRRNGPLSQMPRRDFGDPSEVPGMYDSGLGGNAGYQVAADYNPPMNYNGGDSTGYSQMMSGDYNPAPGADFYASYANGGSVNGLSSMLRTMPRMAAGF